ncbi:MAG: ATP-binding protein [Bacteroidota bacterium]
MAYDKYSEWSRGQSKASLTAEYLENAKGQLQFNTNSCKAQKAVILMMLGNIYKDNGFYGEANANYNEALVIRIALENHFGTASVYNGLISLEQQKGNSNQGLLYYQKALQALEKVDSEQDTRSLRSKIYINTGHCYRSAKKYEQALTFYEDAKDLDVDSSNYGIILQGLGDVLVDQKNYKNAIQQYNLAWSEYASQEDTLALAQLANSIGFTYLQLNEYNTAKIRFDESRVLARKIENDLLYLDALQNLLALPNEYKDNSQFSVYYDELIRLQQRGIGNFKDRNKLANALANNFVSNQNYQSAYNVLKTQSEDTDTVVGQLQKQDSVLFDLREEDALLKEEILDKNQLIIGLMAIAMIVLLVLAVVMYRLQEKEKLRRQAEEGKRKIEEEKRKIEEEKSKAEEKSKKTEKAKRIQYILHTQQVLGLEKELREKLSFELHDIKTDCAALRNKLQFALEYEDKIQPEKYYRETLSRANEIIIDIRNVSKELNPPADNGWHKSLSNILAHLEEYPSLEVSMEKPDNLEDYIDNDKGYTLYNVLHVLIDNVIQHANATIVDFKINVEEDQLYASITDDGKGFKHTIDQEGTGLKSVRERINKLRGDISYHSAENQGTKVSLSIPLII